MELNIKNGRNHILKEGVKIDIKNFIEEYISIDKSKICKIVDGYEIKDIKLQNIVIKLGKDIYDFTSNMIKEQIEIADKYDVMSEYDENINPKFCEFKLDKLTDSFISIQVKDDCRGDVYDISYITLTFEELCEYNKNEYTKRCITKKMFDLQQKIGYKKKEIEKYENVILSLKNELYKLNDVVIYESI